MLLDSAMLPYSSVSILVAPTATVLEPMLTQTNVFPPLACHPNE
jgi:hypothetical protein